MESTDRSWNRVAWWRSQGVEARWARLSNGGPCMTVEAFGRYHVLSGSAWRSISEKLDKGVTLRDAVDGVWCLIDVFSVPLVAGAEQR